MNVLGRQATRALVGGPAMTTLKLTTWNVNSLNVRLPQVIRWLQDNPVDVLCLQELKIPDERFPVDAFQEIGYSSLWAGQKTYNGVALIARSEGRDVQRNIPGFDDPQQRILAATYDTAIGPMRVISAYCPNGQDLESDKYSYKLAWYEALHDWLQKELLRYPHLAILGDYNIAPTDADVHDPAKWQNCILVSEPERAALRKLLDLGLHDAYRLFEQVGSPFTWWDYRRYAFRRDAGLRIDHALLSDTLKPLCIACEIDREPRTWEQPSDHTPVTAVLALP